MTKITNFWKFYSWISRFAEEEKKKKKKKKKNPLSDKMILKNRVNVNVYPLSPPTQIDVTANFRGSHVLKGTLKKGKSMKLLKLNA